MTFYNSKDKDEYPEPQIPNKSAYSKPEDNYNGDYERWSPRGNPKYKKPSENIKQDQRNISNEPYPIEPHLTEDERRKVKEMKEESRRKLLAISDQQKKLKELKELELLEASQACMWCGELMPNEEELEAHEQAHFEEGD
jgi:hypothetical protein